MKVEQHEAALFGGFIITGSGPKTLMLRAIGPSLSMSGVLADPQLQIFDEGGNEIAFNDNWNDATNRQQMIDTQFQPGHEAEAAILISLPPGLYTAVVRGKGDTTGIAVVEAYDMGQEANAKLANISTRGFVQTEDNVMIGGFFVMGAPQRVIARAVGPSLTLPSRLQDPTLQLFDSDGNAIGFNDNWRDTQEQEIKDTTIPPSDDAEAAIVATLPPGGYTAVVRGAGGTTGIALVELYALQ
jgi:hypothetical protein